MQLTGVPSQAVPDDIEYDILEALIDMFMQARDLDSDEYLKLCGQARQILIDSFGFTTAVADAYVAIANKVLSSVEAMVATAEKQPRH